MTREPRPLPPRDSLDRAVAAQRAWLDATAARGPAFLAAFEDGWTLREIGEAVGMTHPAVLNRIRILDPKPGRPSNVSRLAASPVSLPAGRPDAGAKA